MSPRRTLLGWAVAAGALAAFPAGALAAGDVLVSNGSPPAPFSHNKQNEPALAVDAHDPLTLAAGSNDEIDDEACQAGDPTKCPFTDGVGNSGIYFSFDGGNSWQQPSYPGYSARTAPSCNLRGTTCQPDTPAEGGQIGTLPNYYENGLVSDGDPALAFGPRRDQSGRFSWDAGSRLYYANLASAFPGASPFRGYEAIAVSSTTNPRAAAAGGAAGAAAWSNPAIVSRQSGTTFSDKEQIWADNAATSRYFGNAYICFANYGSNSGGNGYPETIVVARSRDEGQTWAQKTISAANVNANNPGRDGCTLRTDSQGRLYVLYRGLDPRTHQEGQLLARSDDGGVSFEKPHLVAAPARTAGLIDPVILRPVMDGLAGARADLAPAPSVDIANGAPSGANAGNEVVMSWIDGGPINAERLLYSTSANRGASFSTPQQLNLPAGDRPYYTAPAISPDGGTLYMVYNAFTNTYRPNTTDGRGLLGVFLSAPVNNEQRSPSFGQVGAFAELHRGTVGDPRGSSQNNLVAEFLGDYVYAIGTNAYGAAVWNDVRNAADCPADDSYRQAYETAVQSGQIPPNAAEDGPAAAHQEEAAPHGASKDSGTPPARPDVQAQCPDQRFGNSDIYGTTTYVAPAPSGARVMGVGRTLRARGALRSIGHRAIRRHARRHPARRQHR